MNFNEIAKRQTTIILVSVICMVVLIIGSSYALFMQVDSSSDQVVEAGTLSVQFANKDAALTTATVPQSDIEAKEGIAFVNKQQINTYPYAFSVTNNGTLDAVYSINIYVNPDTTNTIPVEYIRYSVNDGEPAYLKDAPVSNGFSQKNDGSQVEVTKYNISKDNFITPSNSKYDTYAIRIWIDEDAPTSIIGTAVSFKVEIYSEVYENDAQDIN